jgi:hypothetical protein
MRRSDGAYQAAEKLGAGQDRQGLKAVLILDWLRKAQKAVPFENLSFFAAYKAPKK